MEEYQKLYNQGMSQIQSGDLRSALTTFQQCVKANPNFPDSYHMIGQILFEGGDQDMARKFYEKALKISPDFVPSLMAMAASLGMNGDFINARNYYSRCIELKPDSVEALHGIGQSYLYEGHIPEAIVYFRKSTELQPGFFAGWGSLGDCYRMSNQFEEAIKHYLKAIAIQPYIEFQFGLGMSYYQNSQPREAKTHLKSCCEQNPAFLPAIDTLANVYFDLKEFEEGIGFFKGLLKSNPDYPHPGIGLGVIYTGYSNYKEAESCYRNCLKSLPNELVVLEGIGTSLLGQEKHEESIEFFNKALTINPEHFSPWMGLGYAYIGLDNYEESIEKFKKALRLNPRTPAPYYGLGSAYFKNNEVDEAIVTLKRGVEILDYFGDAWLGLGQCYHSQNDREKSLQCLHRYIYLTKDTPFENEHALSIFSDFNYDAPFLIIRLSSQLVSRGNLDFIVEQVQLGLVNLRILNYLENSFPDFLSGNEMKFVFHSGDPIRSYELAESFLDGKNPSLDLIEFIYYEEISKSMFSNPFREGNEDRVKRKDDILNALSKDDLESVSPERIYYTALYMLEVGENDQAINLLERISEGFAPASVVLYILSTNHQNDRLEKHKSIAVGHIQDGFYPYGKTGFNIRVVESDLEGIVQSIYWQEVFRLSLRHGIDLTTFDEFSKEDTHYRFFETFSLDHESRTRLVAMEVKSEFDKALASDWKKLSPEERLTIDDKIESLARTIALIYDRIVSEENEKAYEAVQKLIEENTEAKESIVILIRALFDEGVITEKQVFFLLIYIKVVQQNKGLDKYSSEIKIILSGGLGAVIGSALVLSIWFQPILIFGLHKILINKMVDSVIESMTDTRFDNFKDFEEALDQFILEQIDQLGETGFKKKYFISLGIN